jgi:hypothetical protein
MAELGNPAPAARDRRTARVLNDTATRARVLSAVNQAQGICSLWDAAEGSTQLLLPGSQRGDTSNAGTKANLTQSTDEQELSDSDGDSLYNVSDPGDDPEFEDGEGGQTEEAPSDEPNTQPLLKTPSLLKDVADWKEAIFKEHHGKINKALLNTRACPPVKTNSVARSWSADTDGVAVTCVGFRPDALKDIGVSIQHKETQSVPDSCPYTMTLPLGSHDSAGKILRTAKLKDIATLVMSSDPGLQIVLGFPTLRATPKQNNSVGRCRARVSEAMRQCHMELLLRATNGIMAGRGREMEQFQLQDTTFVSDTDLARFSEIYREHIEEVSQRYGCEFEFEHMRTFFLYQHGQRNTFFKVVNGAIVSRPTGVVQVPTEAQAIRDHVRKNFTSKLHLKHVQAVSLSLAVQTGFYGRSIYVLEKFAKEQGWYRLPIKDTVKLHALLDARRAWIERSMTWLIVLACMC